MDITNSVNSSTKSLQSLQMKDLIEAIKEFLKTKTDNSAFIIKKFLEAYSVTIDVNIFDPDRSYGAQFYVILYEMFTKLDSQSSLVWDCIDVLSNACRNCAARQALIDTYQFVPPLSRLLGDQLSDIKKKKLLKLLQDLTCGIKLSWQVPHLPHLLKTLTNWVENKDQEIICLSLGVLVNLCYKNLPAIYTLSRTVDMRKFLRFCLPLQGPLVEVHVCKLMIIIDKSQDEIPKKTLSNLIELTFVCIAEALVKNDPVLLRLIIEFFIDIICDENIKVFKEYNCYSEQIGRFIQLINARKIQKDPNSTPLIQHDPDCINLVLKLIYTLEINDIGDLTRMYQEIFRLALDWLHSETVSCQALNLLMIIAEKSITLENGGGDNNIFHILITKLPEFLVMLEAETISMNACIRLGSLLQLLRIMLKCALTSADILQVLDENTLRHIFSPILSDEYELNGLPKLKISGDATISTAVIDTFVYAIGLVNELSQQNASWLEFLSMLLDNKTIHSILAQALYGSPSKVKKLVLEISKYPRFPIDKVAAAMESSQKLFNTPNSLTSLTENKLKNDVTYPPMSVIQMEILDDLLHKFKQGLDKNDPENISTKQLMEFYEYKIASLSHSERNAVDSVAAASERCVHLQHRLAQLTSELDRLRQLLFKHENALERVNNALSMERDLYIEARQQADREIEKRDQAISNMEAKIKELKVELKQMMELKESIEEQKSKKEQIIQKLQETGNKIEKQLQKREEQMKNANLHIDTLNMQNQDLQKMLSQKEAKLAEMTKQYLATKEIINTITKVANSQLP